MALIVFAGKKGSGKDSAAEALMERYKFTRIAMADPLKEMCSEVFKIPMINFHDRVLKEKLFDEPIVIDYLDIDEIRKWLTSKGIDITYEMREAMEEIGHNHKIYSIRGLLVFVGTDLIRHNVNPDVWLNLALDKIKDTEKHVVVTDARFENERRALKQIGGVICLVKRPGLMDESTHETENSLGDEDSYDVIFDNVGTLNAFQSNVTMWLTLRRDSLGIKY